MGKKLAINGGNPVRNEKIFYGRQCIDEDDTKAVTDTLLSPYITCGPKVTEYPFNPYLRNAIIAWYNGTRIDWENLIIEDKKTSENYFLLPIILGAYKHYIGKLQK